MKKEIISSDEIETLDSYVGLTYFVDWGEYQPGFVEEIKVDEVKETPVIKKINMYIDNFLLTLDSKEIMDVAAVSHLISDVMYKSLPFYGLSSAKDYYKLSKDETDVAARKYFEYNGNEKSLSNMLKTGMLSCTGHELIYLQKMFSDGWRLYNVSKKDESNDISKSKLYVHTVAAKDYGDFFGIIDSSRGFMLSEKYEIVNGIFTLEKNEFNNRFAHSKFYRTSE